MYMAYIWVTILSGLDQVHMARKKLNFSDTFCTVESAYSQISDSDSPSSIAMV